MADHPRGWLGSIQRTASGCSACSMSRLTTTGSWSLRTRTHFQRLVGARVDLLMRHIGWDVDEVAWIGLGDVLQSIAPAHPRPALDHIDDALE